MICATLDPWFSNLTIWILGELWKIPLQGRYPGPSGSESLGEQGTDTTYLWNSSGHAKGPPNLQNGALSDGVTHPHMQCDWRLLLASAFRETVCPQRPTQSPKTQTMSLLQTRSVTPTSKPVCQHAQAPPSHHDHSCLGRSIIYWYVILGCYLTFFYRQPRPYWSLSPSHPRRGTTLCRGISLFTMSIIVSRWFMVTLEPRSVLCKVSFLEESVLSGDRNSLGISFSCFFCTSCSIFLNALTKL